MVRELRPALVHTHTAKAGTVGRLAALAAHERPVIVHTYHGHVLEGYFDPLRSGAYRRMEQALARVSDCLIGVSQRTVDDLVRLGVAPRERFRVVPVGLDLAPFAAPRHAERAPLRAELGASEDDVIALYAGRLVPIKRLDVLLRAVARARAAGAALRLVIVGDGELRGGLERLARELGIGDAVPFLGWRRDMPSLMAAADIAVLSSDNEGTPVSLIEAAAAGLPAAATRVGGVAEVLPPNGGVLVAAGDDSALGDALQRLAADPDARAQMGTAARVHALERFGSGRLVADMEALYDDLLDRKNEHGRQPNPS